MYVHNNQRMKKNFEKKDKKNFAKFNFENMDI